MSGLLMKSANEKRRRWWEELSCLFLFSSSSLQGSVPRRLMWGVSLTPCGSGWSCGRVEGTGQPLEQHLPFPAASLPLAASASCAPFPSADTLLCDGLQLLWPGSKRK